MFYILLSLIDLENSLGLWLRQSFENHESFKIFLGLFGVGLLLNLTPCVYPMIPITLGYFSRQKKEKGTLPIILSFFYFLGITITYGILGGIAAAFGGTFGVLFTKPWFLITFGILLIILGCSMFDFFTIRIPSFLNKTLIVRNGILGAFIMGLLLGIAAAPCAGPLVTAVFLEMAKLGNPILSILSFLTIGFGLGLPYFLLGSISQNIVFLPRSGNWLNWVKGILGILVLAIGFSYVLSALSKEFQDQYKTSLWIGFYAFSLILLSWSQNKVNRFEHLLYGITFAFIGWIASAEWQETQNLPSTQVSSFSLSQPIYLPLTPITLEKAKHSGKTTFIDVTANWCKICKKIESNVLHKPEAIRLLKQVQLLQVDWSTGVKEEYINYTQELLKIPGLPFFVFLKPNGTLSHTATDLKSVDELKAHLNQAGAILNVQ